MKTAAQHIEYIRSKPHHVRKRIVFVASSVITGFIAFIWIVTGLVTDSFAVKQSSFADATGGSDTGVAVVQVNANRQGLAAVGAAVIPQSTNSAPAQIEVVNSVPVVSPIDQSNKTVIPF